MGQGEKTRLGMRQSTTKHLYAYWNEVRGERLAPKRFDIEPAQIASILPETFILERSNDGEFRFRLAGTRICESFGREFRGARLLDLWQSNDQAKLDELLLGSLQNGAVGVIYFHAETEKQVSIECEMLLLPLLHTGDRIDRLLGSLATLEKPFWLGATPLVRLQSKEISVIWPDGRPCGQPRSEVRRALAKTEPTYTRIVTSAHRSFKVYDGGRAKDGSG